MLKVRLFLKNNISALQFLVLQPQIDRGEPEGTGLKELITDPYIVIAAGKQFIEATPIFFIIGSLGVEKGFVNLKSNEIIL